MGLPFMPISWAPSANQKTPLAAFGLLGHRSNGISAFG
jgi:hypothetical protein